MGSVQIVVFHETLFIMENKYSFYIPYQTCNVNIDEYTY